MPVLPAVPKLRVILPHSSRQAVEVQRRPLTVVNLFNHVPQIYPNPEALVSQGDHEPIRRVTCCSQGRGHTRAIGGLAEKLEHVCEIVAVVGSKSVQLT